MAYKARRKKILLGWKHSGKQRRGGKVWQVERRCLMQLEKRKKINCVEKMKSKAVMLSKRLKNDPTKRKQEEEA